MLREMEITMFFANAAARCCAPLSAILLYLRFSVLSICMKNCICVYGRDGERMTITLFFSNASARCCAPTVPI